jgi:hypothetical protein
METYRITPVHHGYRVEAVKPDGQTRVVRTWPTEDEAVSHLKQLRANVELITHRMNPGERDWRG